MTQPTFDDIFSNHARAIIHAAQLAEDAEHVAPPISPAAQEMIDGLEAFLVHLRRSGGKFDETIMEAFKVRDVKRPEGGEGS